MATKLSISDLADVLAALKEVSKPYQLGIQLKIDSSELDSIEKNHPRDIGQQKTEVVKYWLRNSPDASWTTLANAVVQERMGGYARLVDNLRGYSKQDQPLFLDFSINLPHQYQTDVIRYIQHTNTTMIEEPVHVLRNILILGKREHGKSTLGNRLLNSDRYFGINDQLSQTRSGMAMLTSASSKKTYKIDVYDHNGLFEGFSSIDALSSNLLRELHLVIIILKYGCSLDEDEPKGGGG